MPTIPLAAPDDFDGWRIAVRQLVAEGVAPAAVTWHVAQTAGDLFDADPSPPAAAAPPSFSVPKAFLALAQRVICHTDPERFALLHQALAALRQRPKLLEDGADPLVNRLYLLDKAVRRDVQSDLGGESSQ